MNRVTARLIVSLAALALLVAACGDDSGSPFGSSTTAAGTVTTTGGDVTTPTEGSGTTSGETTTTAGQETTTSQAGASGEIEDLLERYQTVPLRTTYLLDDDQEITFVQDPTQDPPASAIIYEGGKMISSGEGYIICSGEGAGAMCLSMADSEGMDMATAFLGPFAGLALSLQEGMTDVPGYQVETQEVEIAGRNGVCFTIAPDATLGAGYEYVRTCVDAELGFTLLVQVRESGSAEAETVMELLAFADPQPGDFEPTGPVTEVPDA